MAPIKEYVTCPGSSQCAFNMKPLFSQENELCLNSVTRENKKTQYSYNLSDIGELSKHTFAYCTECSNCYIVHRIGSIKSPLISYTAVMSLLY